MTWRAHYRTPDGRPRNKSFDRERQAKAFLITVEASKASGAFVDPSRSKLTVGTLADQWLAAKVNLKPTSFARVDGALHVHVRPRWGSVALSKVEHGDVQAWVTELSVKMSGASVRKVHGVLHGILAMAVKDRRLAANPAAGVNLPPLNTKRRRYLTAGEVEALANAAGSGRLAVYVLAYCGLRWSELAGLKAGNVDILRRRLSVERAVTEVNGSGLVWGTPKGHERRSVPIPRFLVDELAQQLAGRDREDLAFPAAKGGVLRNRAARRSWFDAAAAATEIHITPHELRHTAASLAVSAGANVKAVQRMLGHKSAALTLDTYSDLFDTDLDAVADRLDDIRESARVLFVANPLPRAELINFATQRRRAESQ